MLSMLGRIRAQAVEESRSAPTRKHLKPAGHQSSSPPAGHEPTSIRPASLLRLCLLQGRNDGKKEPLGLQDDGIHWNTSGWESGEHLMGLIAAASGFPPSALFGLRRGSFLIYWPSNDTDRMSSCHVWSFQMQPRRIRCTSDLDVTFGWRL